MRVPPEEFEALVEQALEGLPEEFAELIEKFRSGRRGKLINIYRILLNAPALAESWFNHSNAVRWKTTLDGRLLYVPYYDENHLDGLDTDTGKRVDRIEIDPSPHWIAFTDDRRSAYVTNPEEYGRRTD